MAQKSTILQILAEHLPRTTSGCDDKQNSKTHCTRGFCIQWRGTDRYTASAIEKGATVKERGTENPRGSVWYNVDKKELDVFL